MKQSAKNFRRFIVSIVGFPLLAAGIILIPIPGPGLLLSFLALFILSFEFDWASKGFQKTKSEFRKIYIKAKERADKIENLGNKPRKK